MVHFQTWESALTVLIVVFLGGLIVAKLTEKPKIPDVAAYLVFGILVGPALLNIISEPTTSEVNQFILNFGATLILFDGGRGVEFKVLRRVWISITMLATIGVLVTTFVVGLVAHFVLGTPWIISFLIGSVIASTDPATLIPVFRRVPIIARLQQTVESESAFNDATGSVIVFTLVALIGNSGSFHIMTPILSFLQSAVVGLLVGGVCGLLALWLVSRRGWGVFHEFGSIVLLVLAIGSFHLAELLHGSGLMAAFVAGVISGNGKSFRLEFAPHTEDNIHHFGNAITLLMRMLIFVLLGTQVDFQTVHQYLWPGLAVVATLILIGRPLTVLSSVTIDRKARWRWKDILFMFWVRETGVIPAALAGMLAASHVPHSDLIGAVTFLAILVTILLQASTTGIVGKKLGLLLEGHEEEV